MLALLAPGVGMGGGGIEPSGGSGGPGALVHTFPWIWDIYRPK